MINIFCTKKLETLLKPVSKNEEIQDTENNWSGQLLYIDGKKCLFFIEKKSLYIFLILNFSTKDIKNLPALFLENFIDQLKNDKILSPEIENYCRENYKSIKFFRTDNDQKTLGTVRDTESMFKCYKPKETINISKIKDFWIYRFNKTPLGGRKFCLATELMQTEFESQGLRL